MFKARIAVPLATILILILAGIGLVKLLLTQPMPPQPIAFSHKLHAGEKKIDCLYCHAYAERSTHPGIPSVARCMGCHQHIATNKPEIRKLTQYWINQQPIPWENIYRVPDFVYFSHKRHVLANVKCQECHGPVETMEVVYKYSSLEMGWCLNCHMQKKSATETRAPTDCLTCHK